MHTSCVYLLSRAINVPSESNKQKIIFIGALKVTDEKEQDPDPLVKTMIQNVTDPEHCFWV